MSDQPLPSPTVAAYAPPPEPALTLEKVMGNPSWAEDQLHASLTLRALRWLELLEQDQGQPPQPGKTPVSLDTQVDMFKVISEWLKTSKKTKGEGAEEGGAPGIEQMRELIRQEVEKLPPRPSENEEDEDEEDYEDEEEEEEEPEPDVLAEKRAGRVAVKRKKRPKGRGPKLAARKSESQELDIILARARESAFREDD